eukprot:scpid85708/ scgid29631/ Histidine protein methyltransferase 1 homolog; Arsenic-transactivated protein 2; Methyltransferase-like protein 18
MAGEAFRFHFAHSDEEEDDTKRDSPVQSIPERPAVVLPVTNKELEKMARQTESEVTSTEFCNKDVCIRHVESASAQADIQVLDASRESDSEDKESDCARAISQHSDLIPGVYEGGLKVWECSHDLVDYMHSHKFLLEDKRVLEVGCGAALPGLYALLMGAKAVDFQDYNEEVLRHVTVPNVAANMLNAFKMRERRQLRCRRHSPRRPNSDSTARVRLADAAKAVSAGFFAGDWGKLEEVFSERISSGHGNLYDVIVTSETIYREDTHRKLLSLIKCCLSPSGVVLLAAKSHYFGVGGSVRSFEKAIEDDASLQCKVVSKYSGSGVTRMIIELRWTAVE